MIKHSLACCALLAGIAAGQASPSTPTPPGADANVSPDTPVITLIGICNPPAEETKSANCKTVITRAQFESMVHTISRNLPPDKRREFAEKYVAALVAQQKAHDMGLEHGPVFEEQLRLARAQALAQTLNAEIFGSDPQISDQEIEDFYRRNSTSFIEGELMRVAIPGMKQLPEPKEKLTEAEEAKRSQEAEHIMQVEADKLHARAVAGEDFLKLERDAFQVAASPNTPPDPNLGLVRGSQLAPNQRSVMEMKPGEISPVLTDPNGFVIFKLVTRKVLSLEEVKPDIRKALAEERKSARMKAITDGATTTFDDNYFGK